MNKKQEQLVKSIESLHDIGEDLYKSMLKHQGKEKTDKNFKNWKEENVKTYKEIKELLDEGVALDFWYSNRDFIFWVITKDDYELIKLLTEHGADIQLKTDYETTLHRAAEFGALKVVKFLIENGLNPRAKNDTGVSVLERARKSPHSKDVVPYLVEILKLSKSEREPQARKSEIQEENLLNYLPNVKLKLNDEQYKKLEVLIDSVFVEKFSVSIKEFYENIENQEPEIIFACINLIKEVSVKNPTDKITKKLPRSSVSHHGNLTVEGKSDVVSLFVTGNLTVKGELSNYEGCQIYVGGDLECESMITEGPVIIGNDLKSTKIKALYNDYSLIVKNNIVTDTLIIENHQVIAKDIIAKNIIKK